MAETTYGPVEETQGWEDLQNWLKERVPEGERKRSAGMLAELIGISQPAVSGWVRRFSRPEKGAMRETVCRIIGSSPERWQTEAETKEAERLAKIAPVATESEQPEAH